MVCSQLGELAPGRLGNKQRASAIPAPSTQGAPEPVMSRKAGMKRGRKNQEDSFVKTHTLLWCRMRLKAQ